MERKMTINIEYETEKKLDLDYETTLSDRLLKRRWIMKSVHMKRK